MAFPRFQDDEYQEETDRHRDERRSDQRSIITAAAAAGTSPESPRLTCHEPLTPTLPQPSRPVFWLSPLLLADFRTTDAAAAAAAMVIVVIGDIMEWRTDERDDRGIERGGARNQEHLRVTCWQQLAAHASIARQRHPIPQRRPSLVRSPLLLILLHVSHTDKFQKST